MFPSRFPLFPHSHQEGAAKAASRAHSHLRGALRWRGSVRRPRSKCAAGSIGEARNRAGPSARRRSRPAKPSGDENKRTRYARRVPRFHVHSAGSASRETTSSFVGFDFANLSRRPRLYCGSTQRIGVERARDDGHHTREKSVPCCAPCDYIRRGRWGISWRARAALEHAPGRARWRVRSLPEGGAQMGAGGAFTAKGRGVSGSEAERIISP